MLIANHNAAAAIEPLILIEGWENEFQGIRPVFGLVHRFGFAIAPLRALLVRLGGVPATYEAAYDVLRAGHSLAIFPGGNREVVRPFWQRNRSDFGGKIGWARIAKTADVPVVPIAIHGSHATNPMLWRSRGLSNLLILPRWLGVRWFPVSFSQILLTGLTIALLREHAHPALIAFVAYWVFCGAALAPLLPSKIRIQVLAARTPAQFADEHALYEEISRAISDELART